MKAGSARIGIDQLAGNFLPFDQLDKSLLGFLKTCLATLGRVDPCEADAAVRFLSKVCAAQSVTIDSYCGEAGEEQAQQAPACCAP